MRLLLLLIGIVVAGCVPVYVPNSVNAPLFAERGDVEGGLYASTYGFEVQLATALTDHVGLTTNAAIADYEPDHEIGDEATYLHHRTFEGGLGYHGRTAAAGYYGAYAGAGHAWTDSYDAWEFFGTHAVRGEGRYWRYFVQFHFGGKLDWIGASLATRLAVVDFHHFANEDGRLDLEPQFFIEPAFSA